jgi:hypothetical protein
MAYIGNTVQNQGFTPAIDYFNGNGVTVTFTLSRPIASVAQVIVAVDNVIQNPSSAFGVVGNSITFTSAPLSGTNNIWVEYTSLITTYQGISQDPTVIGDIRATGGYLAEGDFGNSFIDGNLIDYVTGRGRFTVGELDDITFYHGGTAGRSAMMDLYYAGGAKVYGTTALTIPVGTTAERPGTPASGMTRFNSTTATVEYYNGTSWVSLTASPYQVDYLIVAGGGGGGRLDGGGGGAGGYLANILTVTPLTAYTVTIGAGGTGATTGARGTNGVDSVFSVYTSIGGGGGGSHTGTESGAAGGSGGGASHNNVSAAGGAGTSGQGFAGGTGYAGGGGINAGGGGGGASEVGNTNGKSDGGDGLNWQSLGTFYAGGGGGGQEQSGGATGGNGGSGGGGHGGSNDAGANLTAGTTNTGGGGGGGGYSSAGGNGANGGSGIVIIRYLGATRGSGGTITSSGGYTYHTFTSSGTYTA